MTTEQSKRPYQPFGIPPPKKKPLSFTPPFLQPAETNSKSDLHTPMDFDEMMLGLKAASTSRAQSGYSSSATKEDVQPEVSSARGQKTEHLRRNQQQKSGTGDIFPISGAMPSEVETVDAEKLQAGIPCENNVVNETNGANLFGKDGNKHDDGWSSDEENTEQENSGRFDPVENPLLQLIKEQTQKNNQQDRKLETQKSKVGELKEFHESCIDQFKNQKQQSLNFQASPDLNFSTGDPDDKFCDEKVLKDDNEEDEKVHQDGQGGQCSDPWSVNQFDEQKFSQSATVKRSFVPAPEVEPKKTNQKMLEQLREKNSLDEFGTSQDVGKSLGIIPEDEESDEAWGSDDNENDQQTNQKIQNQAQKVDKDDNVFGKPQNLYYDDQLLNQDDTKNTQKSGQKIQTDEDDDEEGWGSETEETQNAAKTPEISLPAGTNLINQYLQQQSQQILPHNDATIKKQPKKQELFVPRAVQFKQKIIEGRPPYAKSNPYELLTRDEPSVIPQKPFKRVAEFIQDKKRPQFCLLAGEFDADNESSENELGCLLMDSDEEVVQLVFQTISQKRDPKINQANQLVQEDSKLIRKKRIEVETSLEQKNLESDVHVFKKSSPEKSSVFDTMIGGKLGGSQLQEYEDQQDVSCGQEEQILKIDVQNQTQTFSGQNNEEQIQKIEEQNQSQTFSGQNKEEQIQKIEEQEQSQTFSGQNKVLETMNQKIVSGSDGSQQQDENDAEEGDDDQQHSAHHVPELQHQRDSGNVESEAGAHSRGVDAVNCDVCKVTQTEGGLSVHSDELLHRHSTRENNGISSNSILKDLKIQAQSLEIQMQAMERFMKNMSLTLSNLKGKIDALEVVGTQE